MKIITFIVFVLFIISMNNIGVVNNQFPLWINNLQSEVSGLVKTFDGEFGLYVKDIRSNHIYSLNAHSPWYIASAVKIFIATKVLKEIEEGRLNFSDQIILKTTHYVDGAGQVNWQKAGSVLTIEYLLEQMLTESDNSATDILIEKVGLNEINKMLEGFDSNFSKITTLLDVRKIVFSKLHEDGKKITNMDFLKLKQIKNFEQKLLKFLEITKRKRGELKAKNLKEAFESYYAMNLNAASLISVSNFLENLLAGKMLNTDMTQKIFEIMKKCKTGKTRLKNGFGPNILFLHKTGTQYNRMCDVGIARLKNSSDSKDIVVVACAKNYGSTEKGDKLLTQLGEAIVKSGIFGDDKDTKNEESFLIKDLPEKSLKSTQ